jgi:hypothetical protein
MKGLIAPKKKDDFQDCLANVINSLKSPLNTIKETKKTNDTALATSSNCVGDKCLRDIENAVATVDQSKTAPSPNNIALVLLVRVLICVLLTFLADKIDIGGN